MTNEKLKRISLGIVAILILMVLGWLLFMFRHIFHWVGVIATTPLLPFAGLVDGCFIAIALTLVLGLYLIAKIIVEIFK